MIIGPNFVFVHNPKTGGTSIQMALRSFGGKDKQHSGIFPRRGKPPYNNKPFRVVVVRNPFDRLVSGYEFAQKGMKRISFEDWVMSDDPWMIGPFDFLRTPQTYWAYQCNRILRFENLEEEFYGWCKEAGLDKVELKTYNQSSRKSDYRDYYTPKLREIVTDRVKPDLVKFGYRF